MWEKWTEYKLVTLGYLIKTGLSLKFLSYIQNIFFQLLPSSIIDIKYCNCFIRIKTREQSLCITVWWSYLWYNLFKGYINTENNIFKFIMWIFEQYSKWLYMNIYIFNIYVCVVIGIYLVVTSNVCWLYARWCLLLNQKRHLNSFDALGIQNWNILYNAIKFTRAQRDAKTKNCCQMSVVLYMYDWKIYVKISTA